MSEKSYSDFIGSSLSMKGACSYLGISQDAKHIERLQRCCFLAFVACNFKDFLKRYDG